MKLRANLLWLLWIVVVGCQMLEGTNSTHAHSGTYLNLYQGESVDVFTDPSNAQGLSLRLETAYDNGCDRTTALCPEQKAFATFLLYADDNPVPLDTLTFLRTHCDRQGRNDLQIGSPDMDVKTIRGVKVGLVNIILYPPVSKKLQVRLVLFKS